MISQQFKQIRPYFDQLIDVSGLSLSEEKKTLLLRYLSLMIKWNKAYNLTAITEPKKMITHHLMDSLSLVPYLDGKRLLDVGSGAGLPGFVLAIYDASRHFTLLDSVGKKTIFMQHVVRELALPNVDVVHSRVENYRVHSGFDVIMTRAVGAIEETVQKTQHLCGQACNCLFMKGDYPAKELVNLKQPFRVKKLDVPGLYANRHLVIVTTNMG